MASLSTLPCCLLTAVISLWRWCKTLAVSINEIPVPDALFVFTEISYAFYNRFRVIKVQSVCNRLHTKYDVSSAINACGRVWEQWSILSAVWNNKEKSTGKSEQFLSTAPPPPPGGRSWIVDVPFQTGLVVWLLSLYPLCSSTLDNDFVDENSEEGETCSS